MTKELNHIFCVDDEENILEITGMCLREVGGFTVSLFSGGEESYSHALREKPDLIMLDVMMPYMDGPATYKKFQSNPVLAGIPVIFLTARVQSSEVEKYIQMGAIGVIEKPYDPMNISKAVLSLWNKNFS